MPSFLIDPCTGAEIEAGTPLYWLLAFARKHQLRVTATTNGQHVPGSLHAVGRAIDVSVRGWSDPSVDLILREARANEFRTLDERHNPGDGTPWTGPHLHLSNPAPGWTGGA